MDGLAADHAAKRDDAVIRAAFAPRRVGRYRDRGRNLKRTRHADALDGRVRLVQCAHRAGQKRIGDLVIKTRLDDQDARAFAVAFRTLCLPRPGHCLCSVMRARS